jgi:short-subunit dehydrogenase
MTFAERYGPWAVVAGASEGIGRAFARGLAAEGVPSVLIARRPGPLDALAELILDQTGVKCVTATIDLAAPDATEQIRDAVGDREIGLYIANAGGDGNGSHFLDLDAEPWRAMVQRNILTTVQAVHHFGGLMRERRRGGLLLVNSGGCYGGASFMACYTASKAFELNFAESLWSELRAYDVDVLTLVLGKTDTPALRALLARKGRPWSDDGVATPEQVAEIGLARLPHGPIHNWGQDDDVAGYGSASAAARRERVLAITEASAPMFGVR